MTHETHREGVAGQLARMCVTESDVLPHSVEEQYLRIIRRRIVAGIIFGLPHESAALRHN